MRKRRNLVILILLAMFCYFMAYMNNELHYNMAHIDRTKTFVFQIHRCATCSCEWHDVCYPNYKK